MGLVSGSLIIADAMEATEAAEVKLLLGFSVASKDTRTLEYPVAGVHSMIVLQSSQREGGYGYIS
jgi:hypothetical protein